MYHSLGIIRFPLQILSAGLCEWSLNSGATLHPPSAELREKLSFLSAQGVFEGHRNSSGVGPLGATAFRGGWW